MSLNISWEIHDNWTEVLAGTYYILNDPLCNTAKKISTSVLTRTVIILSHQIVEIMFFNTIHEYLRQHKSELPVSTVEAVENGIEDNIGFKRAFIRWPKLLINNAFDRSCEPLSSQERLRRLRNESIHWPAGNAVNDLANSAYYTAIESAKLIYSYFYNWEESEYSKFVEKYPASTNVHLIKAMQMTKKHL